MMMSDLKVIILYTSMDDEPEGDEKIRWVSILTRLLSILVDKLLGHQIEVIRLSEYDIDPDTFQRSPAIVIPVLSKNFFKSPLLSSYLDVIYKEISHKRAGEGESAIYFIYKSKIGINNLTPALAEIKSFHYYRTDAVTDYVTEFKPQQKEDAENIFWLKTYDVAYEIKNFFLSTASSVQQAENIVSQMSLKSVYLAQVGLDLVSQRDSVKREIIRNGYRVFPESSLPDNYAPLELQIRENLNQSIISVHLIGEDAGKLIKDRGLPLVEIENSLAAEHASLMNENEDQKKRNRFHRVIWLSENLETLSVKQKLFVENLKREFANSRNTDVLTLPVEELKSYVIHKLDESNLPDSNGFLNKNHDRKLIYIICDISEYDSCKPIGNLLQEYGFDVIFSNFEGEFLKIRDLHHRNLLNCDGTIIYSGSNDPNWIKSKLLDRQKTLGMGRQSSKNPTAIVIDNDKMLEDSLTIKKDALILIKEGEFTKETIDPFIAQVEQS
jgi:hypothetical protein